MLNLFIKLSLWFIGKVWVYLSIRSVVVEGRLFLEHELTFGIIGKVEVVWIIRKLLRVFFITPKVGRIVVNVAEVVELKWVRVLIVWKLTILQQTKGVPILFDEFWVESVDIESVYLYRILGIVEKVVLGLIVWEYASLALVRLLLSLLYSLADFLNFFGYFRNHFLRD